MKNIAIYDTTLRDGAQAEGIAFSVDDKLNIIRLLDELGIKFIEAGNPCSGKNEREFFNILKNMRLKNSVLTAFGSTKRKDTTCENDSFLSALLSCGINTLTVFGKSSVKHIEEILKVTKEENLKMISDSVSYLTNNGRTVFFDAEHFFDGYKLDKTYALSTLKAATDSGATEITLCDTNGGTFPEDILKITKIVKKAFPNQKIGIHCHNDCELAVAGSIAAVKGGAETVQGTLIGIGERSGNANLVSVIADLQIKKNYRCINGRKLKLLYKSAVSVAEICNTSIPRRTPYVGSSAFTHKAGMHLDGVIKSAACFEQIPPEKVGNKRKLILSDIAGKSAIVNKLSNHFPYLTKENEKTDKISEKLKELTKQGYQFEAAEASFIILAKKVLGEYKPAFELVNFTATTEHGENGDEPSKISLTVRVDGKEKTVMTVGNGPVNALDNALKEALKSFYPQIMRITLTDFKVRILDSSFAAAATVRVLITSTNGKDSWTTVGVSNDLIKASFIALSDSVEYCLSGGKINK